jgi:phosphotransferase system  glucose/maltose/N-acetylglucosamine-specific IIC component
LVLLVAVAFGMTALFGAAHHHFVSGRWFDWAALYHHEPIILAVTALGLGLVIGTIFRRAVGRRNQGR